MGWRHGVEQWYEGPVWSIQPGRPVTPNVERLVRAVTAAGGVRWGWDEPMVRPPPGVDPDGSLAGGPRSRMLRPMTVIAPRRTDRRSEQRFGTLVGNTLVGALLVAAGLLVAYLSLGTTFVAWLVPGATSTGRQMPIGLGVLSFALLAAGGLLVAGTSQLATLLASIRPAASRGAAARALASTGNEIVILRNVLGETGRSIPELLVGPFGAALIHELPSVRRMRRAASGWEVRIGHDWHWAEAPIEEAIRDAERVRRWLSGADLDFVVRVHVAVVVADQVVERLPGCAVISSREIAAWVAALPVQRTLSAARRHRVVALAQASSRAGQLPTADRW